MLCLIHNLDFKGNVVLLYIAVFHSVADLPKSFHNKTYCMRLFLDIRKTFDIVNIEILIEKLKMSGIRGTASLLINNFCPKRISMSYMTNISRMFYLLM